MMPARQPDMAVAVLDGRIWLVGSSQPPAGQVHVFDPATNTFSPGPALGMQGRFGATLAADGHRLLLFGGGGRPTWGEPFNRDWLVLDPAKGVWERGGDWSSRKHGGAARVGERVFIVGGLGADSSHTATGEIFHPTRGRGEVLSARLPAPRSGPAVTAYDGVVYVAGGLQSGPATPHGEPTASLFAMDPRRGTWRDLADMAQPRGYAGLAAARGRLLVAGGMVARRSDGGVGHATSTDSVEIYDPARNAWSAGPPLPRPAMGTYVATVGDRVYTFVPGTRRTWIGVFPELSDAARSGAPMGVLAAVAALAAAVAVALLLLRRRPKN
jgi:N-acetylneuraminic acid mutarotase